METGGYDKDGNSRNMIGNIDWIHLAQVRGKRGAFLNTVMKLEAIVFSKMTLLHVVGWLAGWLVGWLVDRSVCRSVGRSFGRSVGWLVGWLVGWFSRSVGRSVSWFFCSFVFSLVCRLIG